jgi:VanZ family protein
MRAQCIKTGFHRILGQKTINRFAAWACIIIVAVLSLVPAEQMTRTGLSGHVEHVLAYVATAFITATAYGERTIIWVIIALLTYAGVLEFLQRFSPGRTSSLEDYLFSGVGVLIGVGAFVLLSRLLLRSNEPADRPSATQISN